LLDEDITIRHGRGGGESVVRDGKSHSDFRGTANEAAMANEGPVPPSKLPDTATSRSSATSGPCRSGCLSRSGDRLAKTLRQGFGERSDATPPTTVGNRPELWLSKSGRKVRLIFSPMRDEHRPGLHRPSIGDRVCIGIVEKTDHWPDRRPAEIAVPSNVDAVRHDG